MVVHTAQQAQIARREGLLKMISVHGPLGGSFLLYLLSGYVIILVSLASDTLAFSNKARSQCKDVPWQYSCIYLSNHSVLRGEE
jgi:hypothetical protein